MEIQLKKSGVETEFTKNIDLTWATSRYIPINQNSILMENIFYYFHFVLTSIKIRNGPILKI